MITSTVNHNVSAGSIVLLTERTKMKNPIFQFWYEGIEDPVPQTGDTYTRQKAKIEMQICTDPEMPFVSIPMENIIAVRNQGSKGMGDPDFYIYQDHTSGLIGLDLPIGIYVRFVFNPGHATEGTLIAFNLLNEVALSNDEPVDEPAGAQQTPVN
jgi:hypothetical protein